MKILVTGANGYLGNGIVTELLKLDHEVVATDIQTQQIDLKSHIVQADLFSVENPYEFFGKPDVLVHLAWRDGFVHNSVAHLEDLTNHMLFIKKFFESSIKKVVVMGSMHEVGFFEGSINENTSTNPMSYYGLAKDSLRKFVSQMSDSTGITSQWLRAFYIVGNTKNGNSIFSKIVSAEEEGQEKFPFTTGINQYDFLDYKDFCKKVALTISQDEIIGVINICSGQPMKLSERVESFIEENHFKIKLEYGAFPDRKYDSKAIWGNNTKINNIIKNHN